MQLWAFVLGGIASWFNPAAMYGSAHVCASDLIPISSHIELVDVDNGRTTDCVVIAKGPPVWPAPGRVLDVSPSVANVLDFYSAGTAPVRIYLQSGVIHVCYRQAQPLTCKTPPRECILDLPKPVILKGC
jgi:rare lipoprotein A (peptidoglycan hydrolase)